MRTTCARQRRDEASPLPQALRQAMRCQPVCFACRALRNAGSRSHHHANACPKRCGQATAAICVPASRFDMPWPGDLPGESPKLVEPCFRNLWATPGAMLPVTLAHELGESKRFRLVLSRRRVAARRRRNAHNRRRRWAQVGASVYPMRASPCAPPAPRGPRSARGRRLGVGPL